MAVTKNSDLVIYNQLAQTAYLERVQDVLDVFNASSKGAIILRNEVIEGDESKRAFYQIGGSMEHRDVNDVNTVTPSAIDASEMISVKVPWKYGPYATTEEAFKRRARSVEEFSMLMGQDLADAVLQGQIEFSLAALEGAIRGNSNMVVDTKSFSSDGTKVLSAGLRTMGDKFGKVVVWVMDSGVFFDIVDTAIDNKIYEEAGIVIYGGMPGTMGKPVLVTDVCPSETIFGLKSGALSCIESQAPGIRSYNIDDLENLAVGFRAEGAFNLELAGYSWDSATGGTNPSKTSLEDTANWDKYATSNKATAGFIIDLSTESGS
jgi:hypothetical protein